MAEIQYDERDPRRVRASAPTITRPTSNARRAELDKLREKAIVAYDKLMEALDDDGHDVDCVLACMENECNQSHSCDVCREDGEV